MEGRVGSLSAQRAAARIAHAINDDRPLSEQIEDLRDRVAVALLFNDLGPTSRNVFFVMRKLQERREFHGLAADPAPVRAGAFANFCPAPEGR